jgi:TPR repeat protein
LGKVYEEGLLLPRDIKQASLYYKQGMKGKDNYSFYRYALCLIKGKFSPEGQNRKEIEEGFNMLNQIASNNQNPSPEALTELG